jgi:hypothetical protein
LPTIDPVSLGDRFTEVEVWAVVRALPPDKASGPDRFTARFLQATWEWIRLDIMAVVDTFWHLDTRDLHAVNDALSHPTTKVAGGQQNQGLSPDISDPYDWKADL